MVQPGPTNYYFFYNDSHFYIIINSQKFSKIIFLFLLNRIHIAVTKLHTQQGVAEKFINDIKKSVTNIMSQPDRKLGKTVNNKSFQ